MNAVRAMTLAMLALALMVPAAGLAQHAGHATATPAKHEEAPPAKDGDPPADDSKLHHSKRDHADSDLREPIPPLADADRAAAFPAVHVHHQHGTSRQNYVLLDRLEVAGADGGLGWEAQAWIGGDVRRLWLRSEGHADGGRVESGDIEVLYGHGVRAWWDVLGGVRHDVGNGPSRTWAAFGVQGVAPHKLELSATAYLGQAGRSAARVEAEYHTLFTNRLILQWRAEANLHGKDDPAVGVGSGLSNLEAGLRLRYEIDRQFAPYIGLERGWSLGRTADLRRHHGEPVSDTHLVAGVRVWF